MGITGNYRSPQINRIAFSPAGKMLPVTGTMRGVEQLKPLDPYQTVSACTMANQAGIAVRTREDRTVAHGGPGSWIKISQADFGVGADTLTVTALGPSACTLWVTLDAPDAPVAAQLPIDLPEGAGPTPLTVPFHAEGVHDVYLIIDGEADLLSWQADQD